MRVVGWGCGDAGQLSEAEDVAARPRSLESVHGNAAGLAAGVSCSVSWERGGQAVTVVGTLAGRYALPGGGVVASAAAGDDFVLALSVTGEVSVCGCGGHGQLARLEGSLDALTPVDRLHSVKVVEVAAGAMHWLALDSQGRVFSCGFNSDGQCGIGGTENLYRPEPVAALWPTPVVHISAGERHSAVLTAFGDVLCFGSNKNGQSGQPAMTLKLNVMRPTRVLQPGERVDEEDEDGDAVMEGGAGASGGGASSSKAVHGVGEDAGEDASSAEDVVYVDVACGGMHTVALRSDGALVCWGNGERGQLGSRSTANVYGSVLVRPSGADADARFVSVCAGARHSAAVCDDGRAFLWGDGTLGQVGDGEASDKLLPVPVVAPRAEGGMDTDEVFVRVVCGAYHTLAFVGAAPRVAADEYNRRTPSVHVDDMLDARAGFTRFSVAAVLFKAYVDMQGDRLVVKAGAAVSAYAAFRKLFGIEADKVLVGAASRLRVEAQAAMGMLVGGPTAVLLSPPSGRPHADMLPNGEIRAQTTGQQMLDKADKFRTEIAEARHTGVLLFLMFLNPVYERTEARERVRELGELVSIVSRIQGEAKDAFAACTKSCPPEYLSKCFIRPLQTLVSDELRLKKRVSRRAVNSTRVLGLVFTGNELKRKAARLMTEISGENGVGVRRRVVDEGNPETSAVAIEEFYNDAVSGMVDLGADWTRWRNSQMAALAAAGSDDSNAHMSMMNTSYPREEFSFCEHSFMFNQVAKYKVLRVEAHNTMSNEMVRSVLSTGTMSMPRDFSHAQALFMVLRVRREQIVGDTFWQLDKCAKQSPRDLHKTLKIKFVGEAGQDEGGLTKEFFQVLIEQVFSDDYGMFKYDAETRFHWFNRNTLEDASAFFLVGLCIGLALFNSILLDIQFPPVIYHKLHAEMGRIQQDEVNNTSPAYKATLEDLIDVFSSVGNSLKNLLEYEGDDVEDVFCLSFEVPFEGLTGKAEVAELVPGGSSKPVTSKNKGEFVQLYIDHMINDSIGNLFDYFAKGLFFMMNGDFVIKLTADELETLVIGEKELDFEALRESCKYEMYTSDSQTIKNLWTVLFELDVEMRQKFLSFVCGSDRAPIGGLGNLGLIIQRSGGDSDRLPTAHTCFNVLLLPEYSSRAKLRTLLLLAIQNSQGFGLQ